MMPLAGRKFIAMLAFNSISVIMSELEVRPQTNGMPSLRH